MSTDYKGWKIINGYAYRWPDRNGNHRFASDVEMLNHVREHEPDVYMSLPWTLTDHAMTVPRFMTAKAFVETPEFQEMLDQNHLGAVKLALRTARRKLLYGHS